MALFEGNSNPPLFLALFPVFMMINLPSYLILHEQRKMETSQSASLYTWSIWRCNIHITKERKSLQVRLCKLMRGLPFAVGVLWDRNTNVNVTLSWESRSCNLINIGDESSCCLDTFTGLLPVLGVRGDCLDVLHPIAAVIWGISNLANQVLNARSQRLCHIVALNCLSLMHH